MRHGPQVRQRVEALTEFSRFALYKEFVCFLTLREIRKVRAPSFGPAVSNSYLFSFMCLAGTGFNTLRSSDGLDHRQ